MDFNDILIVDGKEKNVYDKLKEYGFESSCDAERVLTFLSENPKMLKETEEIRKYEKIPKMPKGVIGFLIMEQNIYINLKISTILITALLLDIKLSKGFAVMLANMMGIPQNVIVKFNENDGEKCIVHEAMSRKTMSENVLDIFNGECCNNQYECKYNTNGHCNCTKERIKEILDNLTKANMFKEDGGFYTLQW